MQEGRETLQQATKKQGRANKTPWHVSSNRHSTPVSLSQFRSSNRPQNLQHSSVSRTTTTTHGQCASQSGSVQMMQHARIACSSRPAARYHIAPLQPLRLGRPVGSSPPPGSSPIGPHFHWLTTSPRGKRRCSVEMGEGKRESRGGGVQETEG